MANTCSSPFRCLRPWNIRCSKRWAKPLRPLALVGGADVVPEVHGGHAAPMVLGEDARSARSRAGTSRRGFAAGLRWRRGGLRASRLRVGAAFLQRNGGRRHRPATDALRARGCPISPAMNTCAVDAHRRADPPAAIDLPGPLRARRVRLLADARAGLGAGPARTGDRGRRPSHSRAAAAAARRKAPRAPRGRPDHAGDGARARADRLPRLRGGKSRGGARRASSPSATSRRGRRASSAGTSATSSRVSAWSRRTSTSGSRKPRAISPPSSGRARPAWWRACSARSSSSSSPPSPRTTCCGRARGGTSWLVEMVPLPNGQVAEIVRDVRDVMRAMLMSTGVMSAVPGGHGRDRVLAVRGGQPHRLGGSDRRRIHPSGGGTALVWAPVGIG